MLNYKLLIVCICIVIALILYIFYWSRLVAYVLGRVFQLLFWSQGESSVWLKIGSINFSVLTGRILFKDVRYHSSNQTIRIVKGQLSWRYWIRVPASEEDLIRARVVGENTCVKSETAPLSCRLHLSLHGLEWFMYNKTAAYDNIVNAMEPNVSIHAEHSEGPQHADGTPSLRKIFSWSSAVPESTPLGPPVSLVSSIYSRTPNVVKKSLTWTRKQLPNLDPKDLLPIGVEVYKAAIVCGNNGTPSLLVAEFEQADGTYGIVPARSKYDLYKQVLKVDLKNASLCYVDNADYVDPMSFTGEKLHEKVKNSSPRPLDSIPHLSFISFGKLWRRLKLWNLTTPRPRSQTFVIHNAVPNPASWNRRRARKAMTDETPLGVDTSASEYAKETKILEAPVLELLYYSDSVGHVPNHPESSTRIAGDPLDIGNGDLPPEWGVDLAIRGGFLRYGPWADRQRSVLQQAFFPPNFADAVPHPRLKPGDSRMWTHLRILIELRDGVTLQIPFREPSKNWQWDGEVQVPNRPRKREAASIHVRAGDSSTISYMMPMVATSQGYEPSLNIHLDTVTVTSSLNDIRLLTADSCVVRCELPSPLKWNDRRQWTFAISMQKPILYLLRDHINMFTDLGKDWASGPPANYSRFIPISYALSINLQHFEISMYVNDHNIIDKPLIREENALLSLHGSRLQSNVQIPFTKYRPDRSTVSFSLEAPDVAVRLALPRWNTRSLYSRPHRNSDIGRIGVLRLDATYCYFDAVHPENIDQLALKFTIQDIIYKACGWTIRHFMILRNNYFGSFTHFSTLYEYLEKCRSGQPLGDPVDLQYREGSSNALQVQIEVLVDSGLIILPAGLRGYEGDRVGDDTSDPDIGTCVILSIPQIQLYLRTHDYHMEMALNIDTVTGTIHEHFPEDLRSIQRFKQETFILDGLNIIANRLFGPPPRATTYLCIWEIHIGSVAARLGALQARVLLAAGRAFGLNFADPLNAPAAEYDLPSDPDVTFIKLSLDVLNVVWDAGNAALELELTDGLRLDSNDLAGLSYSKVTSIRIPHAIVRILLHSDTELNPLYEATELTADVNVDLYSAPADWPHKAKIQSEFLAAQDGHTGRARFLYMPDSTVPHDVLTTGRGFIDTDFYLPQLRVARFTARRKSAQDASGHMRVNHERGPEWVRSHSESDAEELISEADRDARLAKSRPPKAAVHHRWNNVREDMSSDDESDNGDCSEAPHSDSDSLEASQSSAGESWPPITDYRRFTRSYIAQCLERPSQWSTSPYCLTKDRTSRRTIPSSRCNKDEDQPLSSSFGYHFDHTIDTTITRVASYKGISLWLTPLLLPALDALLNDYSKNQLSPELHFDGIMVSYIRSFPPTEHKNAVSILDLHASTFSVSSLQLTPLASTGASEERNPLGVLQLQHATVVDLVLEGLRLRSMQTTSATSDPASATCSFRKCSLSLGSLDDVDDAWRFSMGFTTISLNNRELTGSCRHIQLETTCDAPSQAFGTVAVLLRCIKRLQSSFVVFIAASSTLDQRIIYQAIQFARDRSIVDPLSTTQPSYLIQNGRPHELRADILFKYLIFLRNCLQYLDPTERRELFSSRLDTPSNLSHQQIVASLENHLIQFGVDADVPSLSRHSPFHALFHNQVDKSSDHVPPPLPPVFSTVSLTVDSIRAILSSPQNDPCGEVCMGPLVVHGHSRLTESSQAQILNPTRSSTTLSLREKSPQGVKQIGVVLSVGDVSLAVRPQVIRYAQSIIRLTRSHRMSLYPTQTIPSSVRSSPIIRTKNIPLVYYVDVVVSTRMLKLKAGAESLIIELKLSNVDYTSALLAKVSGSPQDPWDLSMNNSLAFEEIRLQASAVADSSKPDGPEYGVLAAFILSHGRMNAVFRQEPTAASTIHAAIGVRSVLLNVPRSAMRLYRFMEEWRAEYLPEIDATVRALLSEFDRGRQEPRPARSMEVNSTLNFQVEIALSTVRVSLQVMRGTWIAWEIGQTVTSLASLATLRKARSQKFGLQIGSHVFIISSKDRSSEATPSVRVRLPLPTFTVTGSYDGKQIKSLALVETFIVTVKPSHWDTLLSVQQKFGQDFNDLVSLIGQTRQKSNHALSNVPQPAVRWKYRLLGKMKGFSVGLEGVSSTLFLACDQIGGAVSNDAGLKWHIELSDLALSLSPYSKQSGYIAPVNREYRSAFVIIDIKVGMGNEVKGRDQRVEAEVAKIHAVMQPSSIGQLGDFVDHLQAEVMIRKEKRAQDLADFKEKTRKFMRTFEVKSGNMQTENLSWFDQYIINISVMNVGVAFPLTVNQDLQLPRRGTPDEGTVRAFLFSIQSISFATQRGESGQATMKGFSFQFVSHFRQSEACNFCSEHHATRNKLFYPEMTAQLRSERSAGSRQLHIAANVVGFILDIDSSIPDYVSSLIDVYRQGRDRVERLAGTAPRSASLVVPSGEVPGPSELEYGALLTSNIFISLVFTSGRVRMFSQTSSPRNRTVSTPLNELTDEQLRDMGAEVFDLPVVSVWGEYRATPASTKIAGNGQQPEPSTLLFKSTVHSSQNTLRPTLLPFLVEIIENVEERMRKTSRELLDSPSPPSRNQIQPDVPPAHTNETVSSMQVSLSLRIDQSKLELTCQPDANVVAGLNWDSGGFVVNIAPGAHRVSFSGSVGGLTVGLKHGFLSEDCMKLHARNLAFTVDFSKAPGDTVSSVSVICDTEFAGGVRFSRFQDILCFKAVWLDRIPVLNAPPTSSGSKLKPANHTIATPAIQNKQQLTTAVLLRLRQVHLEVDLGQSITSVQLSLSNTVLRTKMSELVSEVSLSVYAVSAKASGNVAGHLTVPDFLFQTIRGTDRNDTSKNTMLDLRMTSGPLEIELESEYQRLILYRAEPLDIRISDDWSRFTPTVRPEERRVRLTFTVKGSDLLAVMSVGTIPKLVSYINKFKANLVAQKEGASRESKAFRISNSPKPDNPLSDVATAMFSSARTKLMASEPGFSCVIGQRLSLQLKNLRLIIFPRSMRDSEFAQFIGSDVLARLDRLVESDSLPPERDLKLSFSSIAISKVSQLNYIIPSQDQRTDSRQWLDLVTKGAHEATIFSLPSMDMRMHSEEFVEDDSRVLPYDFSSRFSAKQGDKNIEDIYITLNMSLYSWLTLLRKTFAREMEQVQASADARPQVIGLVQPTAVQRRKAPEPLVIGDSETARTGTESPDTISPQSRRATLQHTLSLPVKYSSVASSVDEILDSSSSPVRSPTSGGQQSTSPLISSPNDELDPTKPSPGLPASRKSSGITYRPSHRNIERLTMRQLGEATPDVMHPFFMKTAGFSLEDSLPQYVHEYATMPTEEIMKALLKLYSKQLRPDTMGDPRQ